MNLFVHLCAIFIRKQHAFRAACLPQELLRCTYRLERKRFFVEKAEGGEAARYGHSVLGKILSSSRRMHRAGRDNEGDMLGRGQMMLFLEPACFTRAPVLLRPWRPPFPPVAYLFLALPPA